MALDFLCRRRLARLLSIIAVTVLAGSALRGAPAPAQPDPEDAFQWLEEVTGERALTWVREQNLVSSNALETSPVFEPMRRRLLEIMDSRERIPYVTKYGRFYYNFWRDDQQSARTVAPHDPGGV